MDNEIDVAVNQQKSEQIVDLLNGVPFEKCMSILAFCHTEVLNQWVQKKDLEVARQMLDCAKSEILSDLERTYNWE